MKNGKRLADKLSKSQMILRSNFGTVGHFVMDLTDFSIITGWNTVYDFGKRIAGLSAFIVVAAALFPLWSPSQDSALIYQLNDNTRQLQLLAGVPTQIAVMQEQMLQMRATMEAIKTTGTFLIVGLVGWMGKEIFQFLGGRMRREDPK